MGLLLLKRAATMITPRILLLLLAPSSLLGLQMDLYYESLCPDSTRFISNQIPEMWAALKQEVSINFVPYGFATTTEDENGELQFECQHGERECAGNIVQASTLCLTKDSPADQVYLITCMMSASAPDTAGPDCWLELELDTLLLRNALLTDLGMFCTQQTEKRQLLLQTHQSPMCPGQTLTANILKVAITGRLRRLVFFASSARNSRWLVVPLLDTGNTDNGNGNTFPLMAI